MKKTLAHHPLHKVVFFLQATLTGLGLEQKKKAIQRREEGDDSVVWCFLR